MVDVSPSSGANGAHRHLQPGFLPRLEYIAHVLDGYFVGGNVSSRAYFYESYEHGHVRDNTEVGHGVDSSFRAIQRGFEEITVSYDSYSKSKIKPEKILCWALDPFTATGDPRLIAYARQQYGNAYVRHPMGSRRHSRGRVWVPLYYVAQNSVRPLTIDGQNRTYA
jgi:hypothetical protein